MIQRRIEPGRVRREIESLVRDFPQLADDEELRVTAIEGETDAFELLAVVLDDIRAATSMHEAIESRLKELRERKDRYARREEACRKLAQRLMEAADLRKVVLPEGTLSIRSSPQAVCIIDPDFIPEEFWRLKREPNIVAIRERLKAGSDVPGAALSNSQDVLAVLSK
jgi:hypothetical protein